MLSTFSFMMFTFPFILSTFSFMLFAFSFMLSTFSFPALFFFIFSFSSRPKSSSFVEVLCLSSDLGFSPDAFRSVAICFLFLFFFFSLWSFFSLPSSPSMNSRSFSRSLQSSDFGLAACMRSAVSCLGLMLLACLPQAESRTFQIFSTDGATSSSGFASCSSCFRRSSSRSWWSGRAVLKWHSQLSLKAL